VSVVSACWAMYVRNKTSQYSSCHLKTVTLMYTMELIHGDGRRNEMIWC
jgi:hypothetical protein